MKKKKQGKIEDRMAGGKEEYNAFFYSLVSTDTQVYQQRNVYDRVNA